MSDSDSLTIIQGTISMYSRYRSRYPDLDYAEVRIVYPDTCNTQESLRDCFMKNLDMSFDEADLSARRTLQLVDAIGNDDIAFYGSTYYTDQPISYSYNEKMVKFV